MSAGWAPGRQVGVVSQAALAVVARGRWAGARVLSGPQTNKTVRI